MSVCPSCGFDDEKDEIIERDGFAIIPRGLVTFKGQPVPLRPSGVKILRLLAEAGGESVSNKHLSDALGLTTTSAGLRVQVKYLRTALEMFGAPDVVQTHAGTGYFWRMTPRLKDAAKIEAVADDPPDLTDVEWDVVSSRLSSLLPNQGGPCTIRRDTLDGILYVLQTGCSWSSLPARFGKWDSVYARFRRWEERGIWEGILPTLVGMGLTDGWHRVEDSPAAKDRSNRVRPKATPLQNLLVDRAESLKAEFVD